MKIKQCPVNLGICYMIYGLGCPCMGQVEAVNPVNQLWIMTKAGHRKNIKLSWKKFQLIYLWF